MSEDEITLYIDGSDLAVLEYAVQNVLLDLDDTSEMFDEYEAEELRETVKQVQEKIKSARDKHINSA